MIKNYLKIAIRNILEYRVSFESIKAAFINPANILKTE